MPPEDFLDPIKKDRDEMDKFLFGGEDIGI